MSLIDADRLLQRTKFYNLKNGNRAIDEVDILHAPPVQAIPIPEGATNGDIIKAMFPNIEVNEIETNTGGYIDVKYLDTIRECDSMAFLRKWWNAPYKGAEE